MNPRMPQQEVHGAAVTVSFDDGHETDLRMLEALQKHGVRATFYVTQNSPGRPEISDEGIRTLQRAGMEIGSHTWRHRVLTTIPRAELNDDLRASREWLEERTGAPVVSLSYPLGIQNHRIRDAAAESGFKVGRTTVSFQTRVRPDPMKLPITVDFHEFSRWALFRHAVRDANVSGICRWMLKAGATQDPVRLSEILFRAAVKANGFFHLYARSWELERDGLWPAFEQVLARIGKHEGVRYLTNGELYGHAGTASAAL